MPSNFFFNFKNVCVRMCTCVRVRVCTPQHSFGGQKTTQGSQDFSPSM